MIQGKTIIQSTLGIHARPAALIASCVKKCQSDVTIVFDGKSVDPGNYIKLMNLHLKYSDEIELIVEGSDEQEVFAEIMKLLQCE